MRDIVVALDMGNSGGKVIAASMENGIPEILAEEIIVNEVVEINGQQYWDMFRIFRDLKAAMRRFSELGRVVAVGVDGTSGCYAFVNENKRLSGYVSFSRDGRYDDGLEQVAKHMPLKDLYFETGVYPMAGNNLNKLTCDVAHGDLVPGMNVKFLQLSALMGYFLTGTMQVERSMAGAAVVMTNDFTDWNRPLMEKMGIPTNVLPDIVEPGTVGAPLLPSVARETNCPDCRFVYTVEFDSSTALISTPEFRKNEIYLSMGTTINPGVELDAPLISELAYKYKYKNVPVWPGSYMLLSDVPGFFLLSDCLKKWKKDDPSIGHGELIEMASKVKTNSFLDLYDHSLSVSSDDMPENVREFCRKTGQPVPESIAEAARVLYESYAVTVAWSIEKLCRITGKSDYVDVAAISGGARNGLLCQMISDLSGFSVRAGNPSATCLGNILVQFYALGKIASLDEMRSVAAALAPMKTYTPQKNEHLEKGLAFLVEKGFLD